MASSFNVYGGKSESFGGSIPVWLGTVSPLPRGGAFASKYCKKGAFYRAGYPINIAGDANGMPVIKPFVAFEVVSVASATHAITVKTDEGGFAPSANDIMSVVGATFATTSACAKVSSVVAGATEGTLVITMAGNQLDSLTEGDLIALSSATSAAASGAAVADAPNAYLFNDVYFEDFNAGATGAAVAFHGEGILVDRTPAAAIAAQMAAAVPSVIQIKG